MKTKNFLIRNIPDDTFQILKSRFKNYNYNSFNDYLLDFLETIAYKDNYEELINQYIERQNIMIEAVQRNTQLINLTLSYVNSGKGMLDEKKDNSNEIGNME